ncbi:MAG: insulinase family protein [Actinobacteria bacterium]|nr:insulinase family protein [Actinomycetota bacterium]MBU1944675.1 insulinase family protein [Actinomycetota bacterium]MBU2689223.1 insulinase family protein [Actinomycetota bacterium]
MTDERLERTDLPCGARVLSERVPSVSSVSLGIWVDSGSRDEEVGDSGLSHFMEHMLFKGTSRMDARAIAEAFDHMGADINAATGREHTSIYSRVISEHLEEAVDIASQMARDPAIEEHELENERTVVLEEINMHNDSPDELVHDFLATVLWPDHPVGRSVLGDAEIIRTVERQRLSDFYCSRYVGSRVVVTAAGDVEHGRLCEMVERNLEGVEKGEAPERADSMETPSAGVYLHRKDTEQAHITMGGRGLPRQDPDRFALSIMDNLLGGSMSSRLFQAIREQKGLVYSIYSFSGLFIGMGMVGIYCGTKPSRAQEVIGLVEDEMVRVRDHGFTAEELDRAQNHLKGYLLISNEDSGTRMNRIAKAELGGGEHLSVEEIVEKVEAVTLDDLEHVFDITWGATPVSLAVVGPFDEGDLEPSGRI